MSDKVKGTTRAVMMVAVFSLLSKLLGFVRETLIASKYGAGSNTDVFFISLTAISMFTIIISSSIGTTLIPVLGEVEAKEGKQGKIEHLNNFFNIIVIFAIGLTIIGIVFAPLILRLLGAGFDPKQFELGVLLTRIGMPTIIFSSMLGVFRGFLQTEGYYNEFAIAGMLGNVVMITFLIFFSNRFDVRGLMAIYVIAQALPLILQGVLLKREGYAYRYIVDYHDVYMKRVFKMIPPVLVGVAIDDVNQLVSNSLASTLKEGSVSALNYSKRLNGVTTGIFVTSILTVLFPMLSREANNEDPKGLKRIIIRGINTIILVAIPASVGMMVLATPIVKLVFQRGKFDEVATFMTAGVLLFSSIGIAFMAINQYLYRVFYSLKDTKTTLVIGAFTVGITVVFNFILIQFLEYRGIALATSIANILTTIFTLFLLRKKIGAFGFSNTVVVAFKTIVAATVMGVVAHFTFGFTSGLLGAGTINLAIALFGSILLAAIVYFILVYLFKVEELSMLVNSFMRKIRKN